MKGNEHNVSDGAFVEEQSEGERGSGGEGVLWPSWYFQQGLHKGSDLRLTQSCLQYGPPFRVISLGGVDYLSCSRTDI